MARIKRTEPKTVVGSPPSSFIRRRDRARACERADELRALERSPYFIKPKNEDGNIKLGVNSTKQENKNTLKVEESVAKLKDEGVEDFLAEDLNVMFVGINPGLTSAAKRHHYAGPTNHFWPCLSTSGLVDKVVTFKDDQDLPSLYKLGFTNLTARTTRTASELTLAEQREGIPILNSKIECLRPRIACFIGKGIYEIYSKEKCKKMGLQDESKAIPWLNGKGKTLLFVMPSTSGIVTAYKKSDKAKYVQGEIRFESYAYTDRFCLILIQVLP